MTLDVDGPVATLTLDRPERRNALNSELRAALHDTVQELEGDDRVAVLIVTGADPAFCAGLDLKELSLLSEYPEPQLNEGPFGARSKPIIGAVNGPAVTGGLELALACDFLIASERAAFADTHGRVGLHPNWGLTVRLPEAVGLRRARQMTATGNYVDAATAERWGLVNAVVPHEQLLPAARALALDVASNNSAAIRATFATYERVVGTPDAEGRRLETEGARAWAAGAAGGPARDREAIIERGRAQVSGASQPPAEGRQAPPR